MRLLKENLVKLSVFVAGAGGHHYVSKVLDWKNDQEAARLEAVRDDVMKEMSTKLNSVLDCCGHCKDEIKSTKIVENVPHFTDENKRTALEILDKIQDAGNTINSVSNEVPMPFEAHVIIANNLKSIDELSRELTIFLESIDKKPFFQWLDQFYAFLDSLTLFQESAVVHILLFIVLLLMVLNILLIFFGNELIIYFNLEQRFPSLSHMIRLRAKLQRYYLMINVFILFLVCIFGIFVNLLVLINVH